MVLGTYLILNSCKDSKLTLYCYVELVCVLNDLLGQGYVLVVRQVATVNHY